MKHCIQALLISMFFPALVIAQQPIVIPPALSGEVIDLRLQNGITTFLDGRPTPTNGYNGSYLGPTIILDMGQQVTMRVTNTLGDTSTTHWHGLHVSPMDDGGPHTPIMDGATWSPSFTVMNDAATCWYHPHLHQKTMRQVMKGAAGLIIVRDAVERALPLPRTYGVDDIPLVFQFQTIDNATGAIVFDDEADNTVLVNGVVALAGLSLPAQVVRLRLLNASSHRYFRFGFSDNRSFRMIASDAGLLNRSVSMNRLTLDPAERAEILVDFSGQQGDSVSIVQYGTELPAGYPGGPLDAMGMMTLGPLDNKVFPLVRISVDAPTGDALHTMPDDLISDVALPIDDASTRTITITGASMMSMTDFLMNGVHFDPAVINFTTQLDRTEIWDITNRSMMPHPFHIHGNVFYILDINGVAPPEHLRGKKDVVTIPPMNGRVRLITKYTDFADESMPYMYHCHILSHEDNGMMGQFIVEPGTTGVHSAPNNPGLHAYPNPLPVNTKLHLDSDLAISSIALFDTMGRKIAGAQDVGSIRYAITVPDTYGVYLLRVETRDGSHLRKIVVTP